MLRFVDEWRAARRLRQRADAYADALFREPADADVAWLAATSTAGDLDRARWELRYARRALGVLAAQRDALDDKTGSAVAHRVSDAMSHDPHVAAGMMRVAERQFNQRLRTYTDALGSRGAREGTATRLALALLGMADFPGMPDAETSRRAAAILSGYLVEANEALRRIFGVATLPEDVPPSAVAPQV